MAHSLFIPTLGLFGHLGWPELLVLALVGVLIFGKRLPEVGKSIGRGIVEFKRGLAGIEDEVEQATERPRIENDTRTTASTDATRERTEAGGSAQHGSA